MGKGKSNAEGSRGRRECLPHPRCAHRANASARRRPRRGRLDRLEPARGREIRRVHVLFHGSRVPPVAAGGAERHHHAEDQRQAHDRPGDVEAPVVLAGLDPQVASEGFTTVTSLDCSVFSLSSASASTSPTCLGVGQALLDRLEAVPLLGQLDLPALCGRQRLARVEVDALGGGGGFLGGLQGRLFLFEGGAAGGPPAPASASGRWPRP